MIATLKIAGETRTPQGWGIDDESLELKTVNFAADTLVWAMSEEDALGETPFPYGSAVEYFEDGVRRFVGWVREETVVLSRAKEVLQFTCKNVWHELELTTYTQQRNTKSATDGFSALVARSTTEVVLGARFTGSTLTKIDTKNQMTDLLDFAIANGLSADLQYNVDFAGITPPYQERLNITIAAAMRATAALMPDCATWFDYTTTPPTLYIRRRATETPVTIDLLGGAPLVKLPIKCLEDAIPSGIDLNVVDAVTNPADGSIYSRFTSQFAGSILTRPRVIAGTINLRGLFSDNPETAPDLAADYLAALQERYYETTITLVGSDTNYRPGNLFNFTGGRVAWETAKAIAQSVTWTPARQLQIIECGRPPMLSIGNWQELQRLLANGKDPGLVGGAITGTNSSANVPGKSPGYVVPDNLQCQTKSGTATLVGFDEYTSPSVPPKRYRLKTLSGGIPSGIVYSGSNCTGTPGPECTLVISGSCGYNADGSPITDTTQAVRTGGGDCPYTHTGICGVEAARPGDTLVLTQTTKGYTNDALCHPFGGGSIRYASGNTQQETLTVEDSEDDAIARAGGAYIAGDGISGCESGPAFKSVRSAGQFSLSFRAKRVRAAWSANPTSSYTLTYTFGRRAVGSSGAYAAISQVVHVVTADEANETDSWVDVPNAAGYETECIALRIDLNP